MAGYEVECNAPRFPIEPHDLLLIWNRYGTNELLADRFEAQGGTVLIAENAYVKGRHDGGDYYALSIHGHNGSGWFPVGGPERWNDLGVELKPWRQSGDYILIAPNRHFGMRGTVMPANWAAETAKSMGAVQSLPVRIRPHPGNAKPAVPLEDDLARADTVVVWSSSVGVRALIEGIKVLCKAPYWICKDWETLGREQALQRLAWGQWTVTEIASGKPFVRLASC